MTEDTYKAEPVRGKILKFPTPIAAEKHAQAAVAIPGASATPLATAPAAAAAPAPSAFQRLAAVRRRRSDRAADGEPQAPAAKSPSTRPTVSQLVTWLLNLRKGGVGYLYWNAAKLPIEVALVRAARLEEDAIIDVVGHRILVVEPLRPRTPVDPAPAATPGAEAVLP
ncbi:MAG TPA: hypothetical protein VFX49_16395 [Chloroflexota bacterium]|nr:hypothetical protein [Chloroflexota bacterium]